MQIHGLQKNVYRLYSYARTQECLDAYRRQYEDKVRCWQSLKAEGVCDATCQEMASISRATYYRYKRILDRLKRGIAPPSKRPKRMNKPRWGEAEKQLVLRIRRENPTWGKEKIAVVAKRDHGKAISTSTAGRILTHLFEKGLITKSASAPRTRKKRRFSASHAKPWTWKDHDKMVPIDITGGGTGAG